MEVIVEDTLNNEDVGWDPLAIEDIVEDPLDHEDIVSAGYWTLKQYWNLDHSLYISLLQDSYWLLAECGISVSGSPIMESITGFVIQLASGSQLIKESITGSMNQWLAANTGINHWLNEPVDHSWLMNQSLAQWTSCSQLIRESITGLEPVVDSW